MQIKEVQEKLKISSYTLRYYEKMGLIQPYRDENGYRNYSEEVAFSIDKEVRAFIEEAYSETEQLLLANMDKLDAIAALLLEKETIDGKEIENLMLPASASEQTKEVAMATDTVNAVEETPLEQPETL